MPILDAFKKKKPVSKSATKSPKTTTLKKKAVSATPEGTPAVSATQVVDTKNAYRILVRPLVTEKSTALGALNKYTFEVAMDATKPEVRKAVAALYRVTPTNVTMQVVIPKRKYFGRRIGKTVKWKKAVVTLKAGDRITVYEGV